jgi:phage FluMu protein Com
MPTAEQIAQEKRDAEFAAQLQKEEEQRIAQLQAQRAAAPAHTQSIPMQSARGGIEVLCPNCGAINHINPAQAALQHMCGMCNRVLPRSQPSAPAPAPAAGAAPVPLQTQPVAPPVGAGSVTMMCPRCSAVNAVSQHDSGRATQFMCGSCRSLLTLPPQALPVAPPPQAPTTDVSQGVLIQKVRCGQCPAINSIRGGPGTQFRCGSCGALNEVPPR